MSSKIVQTTLPNCIFCHEQCEAINQEIGYEGCECTIPYHKHCIEEWFTKQGQTCPLCRKAVRVQTGAVSEQHKNECAMFVMITIAVNFILKCFLS